MLLGHQERIRGWFVNAEVPGGVLSSPVPPCQHCQLPTWQKAVPKRASHPQRAGPWGIGSSRWVCRRCIRLFPLHLSSSSSILHSIKELLCFLPEQSILPLLLKGRGTWEKSSGREVYSWFLSFIDYRMTIFIIPWVSSCRKDPFLTLALCP